MFDALVEREDGGKIPCTFPVNFLNLSEKVRATAAGAGLSELSTEIAVNSLRFRKILRFRAESDDF